MNSRKILIVTSYDSTFVLADIRILKQHFSKDESGEGKVRVIDFTGIRNSLRDVLRTIVKLFCGILWADLTYIWFGDFRAFVSVFFSRILMKSTCVMIGGYEVAKVPQYNYGGLLGSSIFLKYTLQKCDKILCPSDFTKVEINKFYPNKKTMTIPLGIKNEDSIHLNKKDKSKKENLIVTVANAVGILNQTYKLKGLMTFARAAKICTDLRFVIIGKYDEKVRKELQNISSSLEFTGHISSEEVKKYLCKAKVYCQISYRESFGLAIAEAMYCKATPVVTMRGAIPELVGETGYYVPFDDPGATAAAIKKAINFPKGQQTRERIVNKFLLEKREKLLTQEIESLL